MTWLILTGDGEDHCVKPALRWLASGLSEAPRAAPPGTAEGPLHVMWLTSPAHLAAILVHLPGALGLPVPPAWPTELATGFHPLRLGHLQLVLGIGPLDATVPDSVCTASQVWIGHAAEHPRLPGWVARLCATDARITWHVPPDANARAHWTAAGFRHLLPADADKPANSATLAIEGATTAGALCHAVYAPRWPVPAAALKPISEAVVIGAGLAGAAMALCLVRAGWHVTLLDQHDGPAQGASGLPVGMLSEHVTARDTTLSALSRTGMPMHLRELQSQVPEGSGWQHTWVTNLKGGPSPADDESAETDGPTLTLPAALVRPSALVQAWLREAGATGRLRTRWSARVVSLQQHASQNEAVEAITWEVLDAQGHSLSSAPHVVVTAAYGSQTLLAPWVADYTAAGPLRPVKGQMTLAPLQGEPLAPHAMRQHGVFVPAYTDADHPMAPYLWSMGSTYERGQDNTTVTAEAHARNAASLQAMHTEAHARLTAQAQAGQTIEWAQVRCASLDRLPCVGALPAPGSLQPNTALEQVPRVAGLWTVCALGSRGLTLAMLAAELLTARMTGAPLPVSKRHAAAMDPARFTLKNARKRSALPN